MGGYGSGRWNRGAATVEGAVALDVNELLRFGAGRDTFSAALRVEADPGRPASLIALKVALDREGARGNVEIVHHTLTPVLVSEQPYSVTLTALPCHLGGLRWFFLCPRVWKRVTRLYMPLGAVCFASRDAYGLIYQCQRSDRIQRGHSRLARAYAKLGESYSTLGQPIPEKPKWMRWSTYERLVHAIDVAQARHVRRCYRQLSARSSAGLRRAEHVIEH